MLTEMSTEARVRMVLVVDDEVRATLRLAAAEKDVDMSELVSDVIREAFPEVLERVRQRKQDKRRGGKS